MPTPNGVPPSDTSPIIRVRPGDLILTEEDDPRSRPTFPALLESMREKGRNVTPIFVSRPVDQVKRKVYEGNSRTCAALVLGLEWLDAIEVPDDLDELGLIYFSATLNGVRRTVQPEEWAAKTERVMELTGCTQEQAARRLRCSPASLSRWMASLLMPEKHREAAKTLPPTMRCEIAGETDSAIQDRLMAFATTPGPDGKRPSLEAVRLLRKRLKDEKRRGRKPKALRGKFNKREFSVGLLEQDGPDALSQWLTALAAKVKKAGEDIPLDALPYLFK